MALSAAYRATIELIASLVILNLGMTSLIKVMDMVITAVKTSSEYISIDPFLEENIFLTNGLIRLPNYKFRSSLVTSLETIVVWSLTVRTSLPVRLDIEAITVTRVGSSSKGRVEPLTQNLKILNLTSL